MTTRAAARWPNVVPLKGARIMLVHELDGQVAVVVYQFNLGKGGGWQRAAAKRATLGGAVGSALRDLGLAQLADEVVGYVRATAWGAGLP